MSLVIGRERSADCEYMAVSQSHSWSLERFSAAECAAMARAIWGAAAG